MVFLNKTNFGNMRKYILILILAVAASACEQQILQEADYKVYLDEENTYKVGEPVVFDIASPSDVMVFYSGETGSQYKYKDRFTVPFEDISSIKMPMSIQPRFGVAGGLDIYVTNNPEFALDGTDGAKDRETIKNLYDGGMQGWKKLEWKEGATSNWTDYEFDLSEYAESFAMAVHWHPTNSNGTTSQRTYWINGNLQVGMAGVEPLEKTLRDLEMVTVVMNEEVDDPYKKNGGNATMIFTDAAVQYKFQGCNATEVSYDIDSWVFTRPIPLNAVNRDQGQVIKTFTSTLKEFSHVYTKPGTYTATFVGINETIQGRNEKIKQVRVTVIN